jgi:hypothetical protein
MRIKSEEHDEDKSLAIIERFTCFRSRNLGWCFLTTWALWVFVRLVSSRGILIGSRGLFFNRLVSSWDVLVGSRGLYSRDIFAWGFCFRSIFTRDKVLSFWFCRPWLFWRCRRIDDFSPSGGINILRFPTRKKIKIIELEVKKIFSKKLTLVMWDTYWTSWF